MEIKDDLHTIRTEVHDVRKQNEELSDRLLYCTQEKKVLQRKKIEEKVFFLSSEEYTNKTPGDFKKWCRQLVIIEENIPFILHHSLYQGIQMIVKNNTNNRVTSIEYCDEKVYIYQENVWILFTSAHARILVDEIILKLTALYSTIILSDIIINIALSERNMRILSTFDKGMVKLMYTWMYDEFKNHVINKMII
jgi:hypothetical protein